MARKKKQTNSNVKRGGQDHFVGFKLQFLESRARQYQQALNAGNLGLFHDKVALDFLTKFGQDDEFSKDPDEDPPNLWDFLDEVDEEVISEDEAKKRTARYNKIWRVSQLKLLLDKSSRFPCRSSGSGIAENTSIWRQDQPVEATLLIHSHQYSMRLKASHLESFPCFTNILNFIIKLASRPSISEDSTGRRRSMKMLLRQKGRKGGCLHWLVSRSEAGWVENSGSWSRKNSIKR
jgi:hypothetical protein